MYNMIGSVIWAICINTIGILFIDNYEIILDNFGKIAMGILIIIVGYIFFFQRDAWIVYMRAKEAEILAKQMQKTRR